MDKKTPPDIEVFHSAPVAQRIEQRLPKPVTTEGLTPGNTGSDEDCEGQRSSYVARYVYPDGKKRRSPEYAAFTDMFQRCGNPNNPAWPRYGGRGVSVCERWTGSGGFERFIEDMGPRPRVDMSLDRIDNDGDYEPDNCRWASHVRQNRNTRQNHRITVNGETMCLAAWAERMGMQRSTLSNRLRNGWDPERAVLTPVRAKRRAS